LTFFDHYWQFSPSLGTKMGEDRYAVDDAVAKGKSLHPGVRDEVYRQSEDTHPSGSAIRLYSTSYLCSDSYTVPFKSRCRTANSAIDPTFEKKKITYQLKQRLIEVRNAEGNQSIPSARVDPEAQSVTKSLETEVPITSEKEASGLYLDQ
jgi:hypothetical protein